MPLASHCKNIEATSGSNNFFDHKLWREKISFGLKWLLSQRVHIGWNLHHNEKTLRKSQRYENDWWQTFYRRKWLQNQIWKIKLLISVPSSLALSTLKIVHQCWDKFGYWAFWYRKTIINKKHKSQNKVLHFESKNK